MALQVGELLWRVKIDGVLTYPELRAISDWANNLGVGNAVALALFVKDGECFLHVSEYALRDGHPFLDWARDAAALALPRVLRVERDSWPDVLNRFSADAGKWA